MVASLEDAKIESTSWDPGVGSTDQIEGFFEVAILLPALLG
jgi:hypothetical protein